MIKVIIGILLFVNTAEAAERIKRIAILDFRNASPDNGNAWVSGWISETLYQELKRIPTLTLADRQILSAIVREQKLGNSEFIDPAKARLMRSQVGADSILTGTYKIDGNDVEMGARVT